MQYATHPRKGNLQFLCGSAISLRRTLALLKDKKQEERNDAVQHAKTCCYGTTSYSLSPLRCF